MVEKLAEDLASNNCVVDRLHGGMAQAQRERVMANFRKSRFHYLVGVAKNDATLRVVVPQDTEQCIKLHLMPDLETLFGNQRCFLPRILFNGYVPGLG